MEAPVLTPGVSAGCWVSGCISGRWEAQHELRNIDNRCTEMWILPNNYGKSIWDFMGMVISSRNHPIFVEICPPFLPQIGWNKHLQDTLGFHAQKKWFQLKDGVDDFKMGFEV